MADQTIRRLAPWGVVIAIVIAPALVWAAEEKKADPYSLDTCLVSGQKIGSMGAAVTTTYKGREIRFCCAGCKPKFEANPDEYIKKLDAQIIEKQKPAYPLDVCVVSGEKLGPNAVDYVSGNRLVRFCCKDCITTFEKDPAKHLAKIDEAAKKKK